MVWWGTQKKHGGSPQGVLAEGAGQGQGVHFLWKGREITEAGGMLVQTCSLLLLAQWPQACGWNLRGSGCCGGSIAFTSWGAAEGCGRGEGHKETQVEEPRKTTHCSVIVAISRVPEGSLCPLPSAARSV